MNLVAVVTLACCVAVIALGVAVGGVMAARRWKRAAGYYGEMHARASAIAYGTGRATVAFNFAEPIRRRTAFEILGIAYSEHSPNGPADFDG